MEVTEQCVISVQFGKFATPKPNTENVYDKESTPWPVNTIFIAGDSMINGTDEKRLSKNNSNVKVSSSTES